MFKLTLFILFVSSYCYAIEWQYPYTAITCMIDNNDTIIFGTDSGIIVWVNATTGNSVFTRNISQPIGTCVSDGTFAYFGTSTSPCNISRHSLNYHDLSVQSISLGGSYSYLSASVYTNGNVYFATGTCPSCVVQVQTLTFTDTSAYCYDPDLNHCSASSALAYGNVALFSFNTSKGIASTFNTSAALSFFTDFNFGVDGTYFTTGVIVGDFVYYFGSSLQLVLVSLPGLGVNSVDTVEFDDITAAVVKSNTIYYASKYGYFSSYDISTGDGGITTNLTSGTISCAFIRGDYIYLGGNDAAGNSQIIRYYTGNDCPDAAGGLLLHGDSRRVYSAALSCQNPVCIIGNITCMNSTVIGDTVLTATTCNTVSCNCTFGSNLVEHNSSAALYLYETPYCGNCSAMAPVNVYCNNGVMTTNGEAINSSNVHTSCMSNCDCTAATMVTIPHNTTYTLYSADTSCGNCTNKQIPVFCNNGQLNISNPTSFFNSCTPLLCQNNCTILAGNTPIVLLHNTTHYFYNVSEICGNCSLNKIPVTCFNGYTNINSVFTTCISTCEKTVSLKNAVNASLTVGNDQIVMVFPQAANYTASYSVANTSNSNVWEIRGK